MRLGSVRVPPRRLATAILTIVIAGYGGLAIVGVVYSTRSLAHGLLSALFVLALLVLQLGYLSRAGRRPRAPWKYVALLLQAALVFLPIMLFGPVWHGFPGFLAGSALILLPMAVGVPVFVLVVVVLSTVNVAGASTTEFMGSAMSTVYLITATTTGGIAVFGLSTLARLVIEAHDARDELARAAVAAERLRLARNVHDMLGQSLSAIALRGELVVRLMGEQTDRARAELADVLVLSRRALADVRTVAGMRRDLDPVEAAADGVAPQPQEPFTYPAPRLARVLLVIVLIAFGVNAVGGVAQDRGATAAVAVAAIRLAELGIVYQLGLRGRRMTMGHRLLGLLALAVLVYLPEPFLGPYAHGSDAFLAGTALLLLPTAAGVGVFVLAWAGAVLTEYLDPAPTSGLAYNLAYTAVGMVIATVIVYGLGTVARLVVEVQLARHELSVVAVAQERLRFARDVHDLLGLSLSAITLKCELTGKLLGPAPERARAELADVLEAARRALADVRSVIGGDRELLLEEECRLVASTLAAAEVEVRLQREGGALVGRAGTVLATVLREGATNVLRHSKAEWCEISLRSSRHEMSLEIANDGVQPGQVDADPAAGRGLQNMSLRVESLGGQLSVVVDGEVYRLRARVPRCGLRPRTAAPSSGPLRASPPRGRSGRRPSGCARRAW